MLAKLWDSSDPRVPFLIRGNATYAKLAFTKSQLTSAQKPFR